MVYADDLAERFRVSRPVMRESLRVLESKGMLEARPKVGTRVLPISAWNALDPDVIEWRLAGRDLPTVLNELMVLRCGVEPVAAWRAASEASDEQAEQLQELAERMATAAYAGDGHTFTEADVAFHALLLESSGNPMLAQLADVVEVVLRARVRSHLLTEVRENAIALHRGVARSVRARNGAKAEAAVRRLLEETREEIVRLAGRQDRTSA